MAVEIAGADSIIVLTARAGHLHLSTSPSPVEADATLKAGPLGLLELARTRSLAELRRADAMLEGKPHVAEEFADLLELARPELEAELADWIGGMAAHEVGRAMKAAEAFVRRAGRSLERDVADYLKEENPLLARPLEVRAFADDVDRVRDDVERAAARVELLARAVRSRI